LPEDGAIWHYAGWRFGVRVNRCVFEKKKERRAMLLYRNFYLTLKST